MRFGAAALALVLFLADGAPGKARLTAPRVHLMGSKITVDFRLEGAFTAPLLERIQSGLPSGFDFQFRLVRPQKRWFDQLMARTDFQVVAMYNAVTGEYLLNYKRDGKLVESRVIDDLGRLEPAMTRFEGLEVFDIEDAENPRRLVLRARARLGSRNLFSLIPAVVETDWVESARFQLPEAQR